MADSIALADRAMVPYVAGSFVVASGGWLVLRDETGVGTGLVALGAVSIVWLFRPLVARRLRRATATPTSPPDLAASS